MLSNQTHSQRSLYLKKHQLKVKTKNRIRKQPKQQIQFINSNGIVSADKLVLIALLIVLSICCLTRANNTHWPHVRALTNYFSYYVLEQTNLGIYDQGNNLDETYIEITDFGDIRSHFDNLVSFVQNYTQNGFANFNQNKLKNVDLQFYYSNSTLIKQDKTFEQFKQIITHQNIRDMLLALRVLYFEIDFGDNEMINQFKLIFDYQIYSHSMLKLDMSTKYKQKNYQGVLSEQFVLRGMEQLIAVILILSYAIQAKKLYYNKQLSEQFRKNSIYWCGSLIFLNFVLIVSRTLSPLCSLLQLLPTFQNYDSSNSLKYNFNINLRYALPTVFRIIVPVYLILSGFILYSMMMYPGDYFDDYVTGFFSYFYNNFQYGIYEIFTQIKSRGNSAYLLYVILYFYMVLVGSNIIPALFCSLIFQKIAEQDLIDFVQNKLGLVACPACGKANDDRQKFGFQININSPRSPYLQSGTKLKHSHDKNSKIAKMYIEQRGRLQNSPTLSPILSIKNRHNRAKSLVKQLSAIFQQSITYSNPYWLQQKMYKINQVIQGFK